MWHNARGYFQDNEKSLKSIDHYVEKGEEDMTLFRLDAETYSSQIREWSRDYKNAKFCYIVKSCDEKQDFCVEAYYTKLDLKNVKLPFQYLYEINDLATGDPIAHLSDANGQPIELTKEEILNLAKQVIEQAQEQYEQLKQELGL